MADGSVSMGKFEPVDPNTSSMLISSTVLTAKYCLMR